KTDDGIVLHDKDICIGCGYCLYACPFGAPQFPQQGAFGERGKMDKCTFCAGGPAESPEEEFEKYGANRISEGKLPLCAEMCSTKALLAGDAETVSDIFRQRVVYRGHEDGAWSPVDKASHPETSANLTTSSVQQADHLAYDAARKG
ncbi:4Fe-4S dicluster domain-containing protein, partial [uncultured Cobetia sp.]